MGSGEVRCMIPKLYGWLQQNTLRMMILMKHHTNKAKLNKLIQVKLRGRGVLFSSIKLFL